MIKMTKKERTAYRKSEKTERPEDFALNALTSKVLNSSSYAMREDVADCMIPDGEIFEFNERAIQDYIEIRPDVCLKTAGKNMTAYKHKDKTFAMLHEANGENLRLTFKCGPEYGEKLVENCDFVEQSKSPDGAFWFTIENKPDCSLEFVDQMIDISYHIARLGY